MFDVRRGFERAIVSGLSLIQNEIVGASGCTVKTCHVSGIAVDPTAGTVTVHLVRPNAVFLDQVATWCPAVPAGTPLAEQKVVPVPGTGPYRIGTYLPGKAITLMRNPYFRQWSAVAQPDGYPTTIDYEIARGGSPISVAEAKVGVANVEAGRDDWADARVAAPVAELSARFGDRLHETPGNATIGVFLNTRIPPFDDQRVRRALNFAVDRAAAVAAWPTSAKLTCQIIPPNFPGYRPNCPFTLRPNQGGSWASPDFVSAEKLVAASHTKNAPITLWSPPDKAPALRQVANALTDLGYRRVTLKIGDPGGDFFGYVADSRHQVQAALVVWGADDLNGADFIAPLFACDSFSATRPTQNTNWAGFCDPSIDALIARARQLESTSRQAANDLWARADERVTYASPWIPLVNPSSVDTVSRRVNNYLRHPVLGVLFDQMWIV
ncbi:ABC transporter substrate-binding protein [Terrabacter carboxydivorans]|uniref:Solute-binding protein family 5 domain-containing protein n=1 Tax=Terrabacter carboxydivorans TaxID=619730 RepID=A0ABP5Y377_9MICO